MPNTACITSERAASVPVAARSPHKATAKPVWNLPRFLPQATHCSYGSPQEGAPLAARNGRLLKPVYSWRALTRAALSVDGESTTMLGCSNNSSKHEEVRKRAVPVFLSTTMAGGGNLAPPWMLTYCDFEGIV